MCVRDSTGAKLLGMSWLVPEWGICRIRGGFASVAVIDVKTELEEGRGWSYLVEVRHDDGTVTSHTVKLAWVDHDHWTGGSVAPSRTVEAVLKYVMTHVPEQGFPATFDAARARRWVPRIDRELRTAL